MLKKEKKRQLLGLKHLNEYQKQSYMGTVLTAEEKPQLLNMLALGWSHCVHLKCCSNWQKHI